MSTATLENIEQLSVAERIQLVEDIWDSIARTPQVLELPESQRQELDARVESHHHGADAGSSWAEVKARIQS
jgi:putative addiction module component (TIGR02574 family)